MHGNRFIDPVRNDNFNLFYIIIIMSNSKNIYHNIPYYQIMVDSLLQALIPAIFLHNKHYFLFLSKQDSISHYYKAR